MSRVPLAQHELIHKTNYNSANWPHFLKSSSPLCTEFVYPLLPPLATQWSPKTELGRRYAANINPHYNHFTGTCRYCFHFFLSARATLQKSSCTLLPNAPIVALAEETVCDAEYQQHREWCDAPLLLQAGSCRCTARLGPQCRMEWDFWLWWGVRQSVRLNWECTNTSVQAQTRLIWQNTDAVIKQDG